MAGAPAARSPFIQRFCFYPEELKSKVHGAGAGNEEQESPERAGRERHWPLSPEQDVSPHHKSPLRATRGVPLSATRARGAGGSLVALAVTALVVTCLGVAPRQRGN